MTYKVFGGTLNQALPTSTYRSSFISLSICNLLWIYSVHHYKTL